MDISRISVSRKQTWDQCKLRYKYQYHLKLEPLEQQPYHFVYGKIIHKVAEEYVKGGGDISIQECLNKIFKKEIAIDTDKEGNPVYVTSVRKDYKSKLPKHIEAIAAITEKLGFGGEVELEFKCDLDPPNGKMVQAYIDRLIINKDIYRILDYKTTKKGRFQKTHLDITSDLQLRSYCRLVQKEHNIQADQIQAALYYVDGARLVPVQYSQSALEAAEKELLDAYDEITAMDPDQAYGNVGDHCRRCDWRKICPFWSVTGKGVR